MRQIIKWLDEKDFPGCLFYENIMITPECLQAEIKMNQDIDRRIGYILLGTDEQNKLREEREKNKDNRKWAYILVGKNRIMCWVDNKTMKAYKTDGYSPTWIEIKNFTFERWCTSMDL